MCITDAVPTGGTHPLKWQNVQLLSPVYTGAGAMGNLVPRARVVRPRAGLYQLLDRTHDMIGSVYHITS